MSGLTKPDWRAGVKQALGAAFTPYAPTLTASTTSPTGFTCTGRWYQVGALVAVQFKILAGTSTTAGSGGYAVSLPVAASAEGDSYEAGTVRMWHLSTVAQYLGAVTINPGATTVPILYPSSVGGLSAVGHSTPWTWASGDFIRGTFTYEAALPD